MSQITRSRYVLALIVCSVALGVQEAPAVVVATTTGNTSAPADDPGWGNVGRFNASTGIYLGDRWVLTAQHVGLGTLELPSGTFSVKDGSAVQLTNPTPSFQGTTLTPTTDLAMYRLTAFPDAPPVTIADDLISGNAEVVMIGRGRDREDEMTYWNASWDEVSPDDEYAHRGFHILTTKRMRWGTNNILPQGGSQPFRQVVTSANGSVVSLLTVFNDGDPMPAANEAQAAINDSGGAVFHKNDGQWELVGLMHAVSNLDGQPPGTTVFGNATFLADLSYYHNQIVDVMSQVDPPAIVTGRHVYYRGSALDQGDPAAAIAPDKVPLFPGEQATSANYTNFDRGLNGILIEVEGLAAPDAVGADQFQLLVGNSNDPADWQPLAAPPEIDVTLTAPGSDTYHVTLALDDFAITNQWLQIVMLADPATGLEQNEVFYFGNAPGETGNAPGNALVTAADVVGAARHPRGSANRASIDDPFDFNRDGLVDAADVLIARQGATSPFSALRLIEAPDASDIVVTSTAVPEPHAWMLLAIAAATAGARRWRRASCEMSAFQPRC